MPDGPGTAKKLTEKEQQDSMRERVQQELADLQVTGVLSDESQEIARQRAIRAKKEPSH